MSFRNSFEKGPRGTWDCKANAALCQEMRGGAARCNNRSEALACPAYLMILCTAKLLAVHPARRWHVAAIKVVESGACAASARRLAPAFSFSAIGIAGLLRDSWPGVLPLPGVNLHAIFGAMLWLMVVTQFRRANPGGPPLNAAGVHELCRRLSRRVYLLLYVLFGASQLVRMAAALWNSGITSHPAILPTPENLRDYLAYGVFALVTIHALAAAQCHALKRLVAP
jgi:cytochrome b561